VKRRLILFARVAVAVTLIVWLFQRSGGLAPVWDAVRTARFDLVVAAFAGIFLIQIGVAHRLQRLTRVAGAGIDTAEVLAINLSTSFYGLFLPGGGLTSAALRLYRLTRNDRRYAALLIAILADRVLATAALCVTGLAFWLFDGPERSHTALMILLAMTAGSFLAMTAMFSAALARLAGGTIARLPFVGRWWPRVDEALAMCRSLPARGRVEVSLISVLAHVLGVGTYVLLARALRIGTPFAALGWMRSLAGVATLAPVSVSGLGLREGTLVAMLGGRGVPHAEAFAYSLLVFGIAILGTGLVGGVVEVAQWFAPRAETDAAPPA
jgi:uncharacterized membrane protein YbhN (UPF0104 family)